jgi:hypothetical protein
LNIKYTQRENKKKSGKVITFHIPVFFRFKRVYLYFSLYRSHGHVGLTLLSKIRAREYIITDKNGEKIKGKTEFHPQVRITASLG